jgi:hypothetical protein
MNSGAQPPGQPSEEGGAQRSHGERHHGLERAVGTGCAGGRGRWCRFAGSRERVRCSGRCRCAAGAGNSVITSMHLPFGINTARETQVQLLIDGSRRAG